MSLLLNLINPNSSINLVTGGTKTLKFSVKNTDTINNLYNLSFVLTLGDGSELVSSSIEATNQSGRTYTFTNIKDLAPNEQSYEIEFVIKLNTTTTNGEVISFGSQLTCQLQASADTKPRGSYDSLNQVYTSTAQFFIIASKYTIEKVNLGSVLLGKTYSSKLIIRTASNADVTFDSIQDDLGNGVTYLGNLIISGYSLAGLNNPTILAPSASRNSYALLWTSVYIPRNSVVTISYGIVVNERYYSNGTASGSYISHSDQITNLISWSYETVGYSLSYVLTAMEIMIVLSVSDYIVDIGQELIYNGYFYVNSYHGVSDLVGYFKASDGQTLGDITTPMYISRFITEAGDTQLVYSIGNVSAGVTQPVEGTGVISTHYVRDGLLVYAGDQFTVSAEFEATSNVTNQLISISDVITLAIHIPQVTKMITQASYRDHTPKNSLVLAPGDYLSYQSTYDGSWINAPAKSVKLYDFYPYITRNIDQINYVYSSTIYPGGNGTIISPYGNSWYITQVAGNQSFTLNYETQIDYTNASNQFLNNLFKMQVINSDGIAFSSRDQVGFNLGKPNLNLTQTVTGNNINQVKIGETYSVLQTLTNQNIADQTTDAFSMTFTETIPTGLSIVTNSIVAMINGVSIPTTLQNNQIVIAINKLAPNDNLTLQYQVVINDGLGPNQSFTLNSYVTVPYTQPYDASSTNMLYDLSPLSKNSTLKSQNITVTVSTDQPTKMIGENVEYRLMIVVPQGQKLSTMYGLILLPQYNEYLSQAWLNNEPITAIYNNQMIIFPAVSNIDTTGGPLTLNYRASCRVNNATVSTSNPLYTLQTYYGNLNYTFVSGVTENIGSNNALQVNHPYVTLSVRSSTTTTGFASSITVKDTNQVYTRLTVQNTGSVEAKNITLSVIYPNNFSYNGIYSGPSDASATYSAGTKTLAVSLGSLPALSTKIIVLKGTVLPTVLAQSQLILSGYIQTYNNSLSTTHVYTTSGTSNSVLLIASALKFAPLSFYSLVGSNAAINISKKGEPTEIKYLLTNTGQGLDSYKIDTTEIDYPLDMYVNDTFIQSITSQTNSTITTPLLTNISSGNSRYIGFQYTIPMEVTEPCYDTMLVKATSLRNTTTTKTIPTTLQDP